MSELSQETINRALLGDPDAAKVCTDAGCALPCPECGGEAFLRESSKGNQTFSCDECGSYDAVGYLLEAWNHRPDITAVTRELYAPKWIPCAERLPEPQQGVCKDSADVLICTVHNIQAVGCVAYREQDNEAWLLSDDVLELREVTHWMPLPKPPEVKS